MKRITAGTIDYGICCILACICRIGFTVLCGWALQGTGAQVPYFTLPLYKMGESAGIGTLILNYGVFSQHKLQLSCLRLSAAGAAIRRERGSAGWKSAAVKSAAGKRAGDGPGWRGALG